MKIIVRTTEGRDFPHEADIVHVDATQEGELSVVLKTADGDPTGWTIYARGHWWMTEQLEPPASEVVAAVQAREEAEERRRRPGGWR